jgi:hypothetical protein
MFGDVVGWTHGAGSEDHEAFWKTDVASLCEHGAGFER